MRFFVFPIPRPIRKLNVGKTIVIFFFHNARTDKNRSFRTTTVNANAVKVVCGASARSKISSRIHTFIVTRTRTTLLTIVETSTATRYNDNRVGHLLDYCKSLNAVFVPPDEACVCKL